jgi:predicted nucleotidyltransferase component of viral defense system
MTRLTRRDVLEHQANVPWPKLRQVEQDLLLCRAMAALFNDKFLHSQVAMRGGTLLHKIHLTPPSRYSEDIDLVAIGDRPEEHIKRAINRVLADVLDRPTRSLWGAAAMAIRNLSKPSRLLRMTYSIQPVCESGPPLIIKIETNVTERKPHRAIQKIPFEFPFQGKTVKTMLNGYDIHEVLGTKLRALFQREAGRDLFDLYWALTKTTAPVNPAAIIESFQYYVRQEGAVAGRAEFTALLQSRLTNRGFCTDMEHLLRVGLTYDPQQAGEYIQIHLLNLLPK